MLRTCAASLLLLALPNARGWASELATVRTARPAKRAAAVQMAAVAVKNFEGAAAGECDVDLKVAKSGAYILQRKVGR